MRTQVNIPNQNLYQFIEACNQHQVIYHQIEARDNNTRYEIEYVASQAFWVGYTFSQLIVAEHGK